MKDLERMDPHILLSLVNTKLRDGLKTLSDLCEEMNWNLEIIRGRMNEIGYFYDDESSRFSQKMTQNK